MKCNLGIVNVKITPFQIKITPCYEILDYQRTTHMLSFDTGKGRLLTSIPLSIENTGYYRYELTALSTPAIDFRIHYLHFKSAAFDGQVSETDYHSSPSVHINFSSTATADKCYNWLYEDVTVPIRAEK